MRRLCKNNWVSVGRVRFDLITERLKMIVNPAGCQQHIVFEFPVYAHAFDSQKLAQLIFKNGSHCRKDIFRELASRQISKMFQ